MARVKNDQAVFRIGPHSDFDRRTPLSKGVLLTIKGKSGTWLMADLGGGDRGWVEQSDIEWVPAGATATSTLKNILIRSTGDETYVDLQMTSRASYDIIETNVPPVVTVRVHQTTSMINELAQYSAEPLLKPATVRQVSPGAIELTLPLRSRGAWGWRAGYGATPNMPPDPPGHDFNRVAPENLRIALKQPPKRGSDLNGITVVIDPGHGGRDPGAVGKNGLKEKDVNLAVSLALRQALERRRAHVVMTHDTDRDVATDIEHELPARVDVAQASRGTIFISIHHNARARVEDGRVAEGVFVYYYQPQSADLARHLMDPVAEAQLQRVRAYVFRSFHVIRQPYMPAVLIEVGFISNPTEEEKMRAPDYAQRVAEGIAKGVEHFFDERLR